VQNNPVNFVDPSGLVVLDYLSIALKGITGATAQEAAIAGRMTEAVVNAVSIATGHSDPGGVKAALGITAEILQFAGGAQSIFLSWEILTGSLSFPPAIAIVIAGAGGYEIGTVLSNLGLWERFRGQSFGADIYDWIHKQESTLLKSPCGR
jgi:hypothetical protein